MMHKHFIVAIGAICSALAADVSCPAQDATEFAITYGEPLISYERTFKGRLEKVALNEMLTTTRLSTPQETATVKPNFDTLYMSQCYDLSREDIELRIPQVEPDRFYSISFYTPYGDNYLNIGALDAIENGTYLLTPTNASNTDGDLAPSETTKYQGIVYSPNTIGFLLVRILLKNTPGDLEKVQNLQHGFGTTTIPRDSPPIGPALDVDLFTNSSSSQAEHILNLVSRFAQTEPPTSADDANNQTENELDLAGIDDDGEYEMPPCVDLAQAYSEATEKIKSYYPSNESTVDLGSGWIMPKEGEVGEYGSDYVARSSVARWGYLALNSDVAIYPSYEEGFSLQSNESYLLTFSGKPPVAELGFWSLSLYDEAGLPVANSQNRYTIGDRSNITFPNGELVYPGDSDGPFRILVQASAPPSNWTSNWLPSPPKPGAFDMILRFYAPRESLLNGTYVYPVVEKGLAMGQSGTNGTESTMPPESAATSTVASRYLVLLASVVFALKGL